MEVIHLNRKNKLDEMTLNRINELRFRALIFKMLKATNNNLFTVIEYIKSTRNFIEFDLQSIVAIIKEIIEDRYTPTIDEIIKINLLLGLTIREIADKLEMNESTIKMHIYRNKNNINTIIIYPRLKKEYSQEIRKFLREYSKFNISMNKVYKT